jgi:hypothetical protein
MWGKLRDMPSNSKPDGSIPHPSLAPTPVRSFLYNSKLLNYEPHSRGNMTQVLG